MLTLININIFFYILDQQVHFRKWVTINTKHDIHCCSIISWFPSHNATNLLSNFPEALCAVTVESMNLGPCLYVVLCFKYANNDFSNLDIYVICYYYYSYKFILFEYIYKQIIPKSHMNDKSDRVS